jgi:cell division protein FtsI/penicillin-binding protein 2
VPAVVIALLLAAAGLRPEARADEASADPAYLMIDAATGRRIETRWSNPEQPVPLGSLIKPFTALAYAAAHHLTYPTFVCHGAEDGCWRPAGHGRIGITEAVAFSCNAYFRRLSEGTSPAVLTSTLARFGISADVPSATPTAMVGLGDRLRLSPLAVARGYLELASRTAQPGVPPLLEGMRLSARTGTGSGVGAAVGDVDALVKTGTAPCLHEPRAAGDGYAVALYPADRPRVVLIVRAHGRTGAQTASLAGELLVERLRGH